MVTLINIDGAENSYNSFKEVFDAKRSVRNQFFGSYLTDGDFIPSVVFNKVSEKIKTYELYLTNLRTLNKQLAQLVADEEAKKLQGTVDEMSTEQAEALMKQLKAKLGM